MNEVQHLLTISQHVIATVIASTALYGSDAVLNFAVQSVSVDNTDLSIPHHSCPVFTQLYYNTRVKASTAVLATLSNACFGQASRNIIIS